MMKTTLLSLLGGLMLVSISMQGQQQAVVGIDFDISSSKSVPDNWVKFVGMNWQKKTDIPLDDGTPTSIDVLITDNDTANNVTYNMAHASGLNSPSHIQSLDQTLGGASMCGEAVTVIWSDLKPGVSYNIYVFASNVIDGPTMQTVTITGNKGITSFNQLVSAQLQINDRQSSSAMLSEFSRRIDADMNGMIKIVVDGPGSVWLSGLAISEVIQPCLTDIVVTSVSGTNVAASSSILVSDEITYDTYLSAPEVFLQPGFCLMQSRVLEVISDGCR